VHRDIEAFARAHPSTELFVPDGHCNSDGYRIMGEAMARAVIDAVRRGGVGR